MDEMYVTLSPLRQAGSDDTCACNWQHVPPLYLTIRHAGLLGNVNPFGFDGYETKRQYKFDLYM
jgi:hypothetical protein